MLLIPTTYTGSHTEPHKTTPKKFPWFLLLLTAIFLVMLIANSSTQDPDSGESLRLQRYKQNKPTRNSPAWKDYCKLKEKLEKVVDPNCYCDCNNQNHITGTINWFNPPPAEELDSEWELIPEIFTHGESKHYRHKPTGNIVRYDPGHIGRPEIHYHRLNYDIKELIDRRKYKDKGSMYLNICGDILPNNIDEKNHIYLKENQIQIKEEEVCEDETNTNGLNDPK